MRKRKLTLFTFILVVLVAGGIGSLSFSKLESGGYSDPKSDSAKAATYLTDTFHINDPGVVLVLDAGRDIKDPQVTASATSLENLIKKEPGVSQTLSYWSAGSAPNLKSADGKAGFLFIYADKSDFGGISEIGSRIQAKYDGTFQNLKVYASGGGVITHAINNKISKDLALAEAISIPLVFILLLFVFGALVASAMPLVVGVSSILGAFFCIYLFTLFTSVSVFALNLITGLGLGLGIDYALLIVNRFREELHAGKSVDESVITTINTAGKTVFYSGLTVFVTLLALILFPLSFLKSFGYAGISVVALAVAGALIPLPAILAILGGKIDKGIIRKGAITPKEDGRWASTARFVMRRPIPIVLVSLIIISIFAAPVKSISFAQIDSRVLPSSDKAAISSQLIADRFPGQEGSPIEIIIPNGANDMTAVTDFTDKLKLVPGVLRVSQEQSAGSVMRITAIQSMPSRTIEAAKMIHEIRALQTPEGTLIGGPAADFTDSQDGIALLYLGRWVGLPLVFSFSFSFLLAQLFCRLKQLY